MVRVRIETPPIPKRVAMTRGAELAKEDWKTLRHFLKFEKDLDVINFALKAAQKQKDERKERLLKRKLGYFKSRY